MSLTGLREYLQKHPDQLIGSDELCLGLAAEAEGIAKYTATHLDERPDLVVDLSSENDAWSAFGCLWSRLALSLHPTVKPPFESASEDSRRNLALALAKLERNLVAGIAEHQVQAVAHEVAIREAIFNLTTFARIEDPTYFTLHAVITQLLSNIVSPLSPEDEATIAQEKLQVYLNGRREDDVIIRLLDSQDVRTNTATLHLIANMVRGSRARQTLCLAEPGVRWLSRILSRIDEWHETEDGRFELSVDIFTHYIQSGLHWDLYAKLGDTSEPITPSQTSLLKLIDSHLANPSRPNPSPSPHAHLVVLFTNHARYALISLGSGQDDARLPKIFEGMVLVCEGLVSMGLAAQSRADKAKASRETSDKRQAGGDEQVVQAMKGETALLKPLIDLLAALDKFIPRVKPGTAASTNTLPPDQAAPVTLLKRLLVQLLGILTFEDTATGDRVRELGGVELVLGLTEVDEANPYLREHALLTIRNLMLNNPANQAVISQMDPVGVISDQGEVLPLPEKMRRKKQQAAVEEI
ncbi:spinocerebellar ataxia type 10 protein domain-containing protein, partial [Papiliotrema laurentii]